MMKSRVFDFSEKYLDLSHKVCYKHGFKEPVRTTTYIHTMRAHEKAHFLLHSFIASALDGVVAKQYEYRIFFNVVAK
jgi:hypothetical protein